MLWRALFCTVSIVGVFASVGCEVVEDAPAPKAQNNAQNNAAPQNPREARVFNCMDAETGGDEVDNSATEGVDTCEQFANVKACIRQDKETECANKGLVAVPLLCAEKGTGGHEGTDPAEIAAFRRACDEITDNGKLPSDAACRDTGQPEGAVPTGSYPIGSYICKEPVVIEDIAEDRM